MSNPTYTSIISAAENYLKDKGHTTPSNAISSKDLVSAIEQMVTAGDLDIDVGRGTILVYISKAANTDDASAIVSGGPRGGYWYDASVIQAAPKPVEETKIESNQGLTVSFLEKDLYPLVKFWLETKEYKAKDISSLKGGGKWGNPDILGVNTVSISD